MKIEICDKPIFIVGAPRSGTSMMQHALRRHSALWGDEESDYLVPLLKHLAEDYAVGCRRKDRHWLSHQEVSLSEFLQHIGWGLNSLYMNRSGGRRWVEQTPQYTLHLDGISQLFPDAVFLLMIRDGRQVVSSLRKHVVPVSHKKACEMWANHTRHGLEFGALKGDKCLRKVFFERIVGAPESELSNIFGWLGLEHEPRSAAFISQKQPINSSFADETSNQKNQARWGGWTFEERRCFHDLAGDLLFELGFEADDAWVADPRSD